MVDVSNIKLGICLRQVLYIVTFRLGSFWCIKCHKILHKAVETCSFIFLLYYFISLVLLIPRCALLTSVDQVNSALDVLNVVTVILLDLPPCCLMRNMILEEPAAVIFKVGGSRFIGNFGTCLLNCKLRIPVQEEDTLINSSVLHFLLYLHPLRQHSLIWVNSVLPLPFNLKSVFFCLPFLVSSSYKVK